MSSSQTSLTVLSTSRKGQPEPSALALKLSLFYPYAIVPEASRELVCNY